MVAKKQGLVVGMMWFLNKHEATLKDSSVFSIDCVGIGNLRYVVKEGLLKTISVPEELVNLVSETACRNYNLNASPEFSNTRQVILIQHFKRIKSYMYYIGQQ